MGYLVAKIAQEIAEWRATHDGATPSRVIISEALYEAIKDENKNWMVESKFCPVASIAGVPLAIDPGKKLSEILQ